MSVPVFFAHPFLGRLAAAFVAAYPDVLLEIEVEDRFVDPMTDGFNVVARVNPHPGSGLMSHRFPTDTLIVAAPPTVTPPRDAAGDVPAVVLTAGREEPTWRTETDRGLAELRLRPVLSCSSMMLVRDAVLAGAGAAMMPRRLVERGDRVGSAGLLGDRVGSPRRGVGAVRPAAAPERQGQGLPGHAAGGRRDLVRPPLGGRAGCGEEGTGVCRLVNGPYANYITSVAKRRALSCIPCSLP